MVKYPVHVPIRAYKGPDPQRQRRAYRFTMAAKRVEQYLNRQMQHAQAPRCFEYFYIAFSPWVDDRTGCGRA